MSDPSSRIIRTPDQRLRVFVSSTLQELADERAAARAAITHLRLAPVMFELGARPHPPQELYRAYLDQSHIFIGIYWQKYGWVAPDMTISGLEDEYNLSGDKPKLIYIKAPAPDREPGLEALLRRIKSDASYKYFSTAAELRDLLENDLAMILTESFESTHAEESTTAIQPAAILNNLPISPTRLIGRQKEVEALHDLLTRDEVDLVTLTGPGGTGKTRLAIQAAADLVDHFPDGVFFVALATIREPQLVPIAIATALNMRESTGGPPILERLKNYLRDRRVLLLLDNFEQVVAAASVIFDLLQTCAQLKVMVTSRTPLHLRGEHEFPVTTLPVPERGAGIELDRLSQYGAVQLFVQRALDVKPNFAINNENAPAVAEICSRLDGLPLAIELAAARIKVLTPQAMLARLERGLPLLSSGMRDLPERQQTLRNTIDWSFNLLDDDAKLLFRRLAVFVGRWTLEAAEAVCPCKDDPDLDILSTMEVLIDNSLLMRVQAIDGEIRFGMLGTIREYAQEKLGEAGESSEIQRRHFEYYVQYAERAEQQLKGPQQVIWLRSLEAELDNLRAALEWAQANHAAPADQAVRNSALRLASALQWFWFVRGHWSEGLEWLRQALMMSTGAPPEYQARTLNATGFLAWYAGDFVMARAQLTGSMTLCREANIRPELAYALAYLANVTMWQDGPEPARALAQESLATFQSLGDKWGCAYALYMQGLAALWQSDLTAARSLLEQSVKIYREIGDRWRASAPQGRLGGLAHRQGDYAKAADLYTESLTVSRELGDKPGIAVGLSSLADVALAQGDSARAEALYTESLELHVELNDRLNSGWARYGLGKVALARGDYDYARSLIEESLSTVQAAGDRSGMAWLYQVLGHLALQNVVSNRSHMPPDQQATMMRLSLTRFRESLKLAQELGHVVTIAFCMLGSAGLAAVDGQLMLAAQLWGAAATQRVAAQALMSAGDRADYDRATATVCDHINVEDYPEATAAGRNMTAAEAVTFTLHELNI